jgi:hypothetical protein
MVEVLIEQMYGSDESRPLDYGRAVVVKAEKEGNSGSARQKLF